MPRDYVAGYFSRAYVRELDRKTAAGEDLTEDELRDWVAVVQEWRSQAPSDHVLIDEQADKILVYEGQGWVEAHPGDVDRIEEAWNAWESSPLVDHVSPRLNPPHVHVPDRAIHTQGGCRTSRVRQSRRTRRARPAGRLDDDPEERHRAGGCR